MKRFFSMRLIWVGLILLITMALLAQSQQNPTVGKAPNTSYYTGEQLYYEITFGVFNIGTGITKIDSRIHNVRSKQCYKVTAFGKTSGLISWIAKINDRFGAYVDTTSLLTQISSRKLREGRFRMDEIAVFDHDKNTVERKDKNHKTGKFNPPKVYSIPNNARELLSGFLYIRTFDFDKMNRGDTIAFPAFLEDTAYDFKVLYMGTEKISTNLGWMQGIKLVPIMPENKLFDGQNSISCWLSNDKNRIPIKLQAKMFIGNFRIDITNFKGLQNPLKIIFE